MLHNNQENEQVIVIPEGECNVVIDNDPEKTYYLVYEEKIQSSSTKAETPNNSVSIG